MGIRFYCPNGHKLNVKEFQAGRRGICPFCGTRTQIPLQSTRPSTKSARQQRGGSQAATQTLEDSEQDDAESAQASDSSPDILPGEPPRLPGDPTSGKMLGPSTPVGTPTSGEMVVAPPARPITNNGPAAPSPAPAAAFADTKFRQEPVQAAASSPSPAMPSSPASAGPVSTSNVPPSAVPVSPVSPSVQAAAAPSAAAPSAAAPSTAAPSTAARPTPSSPVPLPPGGALTSTDASDPISEAPEAIWYVRPPSGGQFGPATGDLLRTWLGEGRVSGDSLVWREGWRDWREASELFPKLRGNQIIDFLETAPVVSIAASSTAHHHHKPKPKRKSDHNQTALLVVLSLAVIVLFIVFLLVLFH